MSRSGAALCLAVLVMAVPARAQVAPGAANPSAPTTASAQQALSAAQAAYGPRVPAKTCPDTPAGGEIVVCARVQDNTEYRVKSTAELNPDSHEATYNGVPRAPNVHGIPTCKETGNPCFGLGKVPPPIYYIDLTTIPVAPPGSDADKISKGEARQP